MKIIVENFLQCCDEFGVKLAYNNVVYGHDTILTFALSLVHGSILWTTKFCYNSDAYSKIYDMTMWYDISQSKQQLKTE